MPSKEVEWAIIALSGCVTLYGAWLYFQPSRKKPPLRSTFRCQFICLDDLEDADNDEKFIVVCPKKDTVKKYDSNPLCLAVIAQESKSFEENWKSGTCTASCFLALEDYLRCSVVTSDQFSIDGICSAFVFTTPKIAFANKELLIDIASASDNCITRPERIK